MSIFNYKGAEKMIPRDNNDSSRTKDIHTIIGEGTHLKGELSFDGSVRIDGEMEGEIISEGTLIVGEKSFIQAEIKINYITVSGKVYGNVVAKNRIIMRSSAEVCGNIQAPILIIDEGAKFEGTCNMGLNVKEVRSISYNKIKKGKKEEEQNKDVHLKEVA